MEYLFFFIVISIVIAILSFTKPQLIIWIVIVGGFLGIVTVFIQVKGFPYGLLEGIGLGGFFAFFGWSKLQIKFDNMFRARALLEPRSSRSKSPISCGKCKTKLSYFATPKNFSQFMWGRRTCPNCGAELYNNGKLVSNK